MPFLSEIQQVLLALRIPDGPNRFKTFNDVEEAIAYLKREVVFWQPITGASAIAANYTQALSALVQSSSKGIGPNELSAVIQVLSGLQHLTYGFIRSDSALANFLSELEKRSPEMVRAAISYHDGSWNYGGGTITRSKEFLEGVIAYISFKNNGFDVNSGARLQLLDQRASELAAIRHELQDFQKVLEQRTTEWQSTVLENERQIKDKANDLVEQGKSLALKTAEEGTELLAKTNSTWNKRFEEENASARKRMDAIESAYDERMRLQQPADYWQKLENRYNWQGATWAGLAAIAVAALARVAFVVAYTPPELFKAEEFKLSGLKGAVLIGAGLSVIIYLINLLMKLCVSSFHLARDARERQQLTYVFLALIKEQAIKAEDRQLILSSLFSRADTGLIKGDSTPAIPTPTGTVIEAARAASLGK